MIVKRDTTGNIIAKNALRELYHNYKGEALFFVVLAVCIVLSHRFSRYIPVELFDKVVTPVQNGLALTFCFVGAWLMFTHSEGIRVRKIWGCTLLTWGLAGGLFLLTDLFFGTTIYELGSGALTSFDLLIGNLMGWMYLLYPTETLRPGWLNVRRSLIQLLPRCALVGLNYLLPVDLRPLIALFPAALGIMLLFHIRAYRQWCEENYSSMDYIDVQWVMRYLIMLVLIGCSYVYMYVSTNPMRSFTQQWLLLLFLVYSTEQILFRRDPWQALRTAEEVQPELARTPSSEPVSIDPSTHAEERRQLEAWMETAKPYHSPDFRLMDLNEVLPMNRTYLSQLINTEYGCTFYHFANHYRVEEAKRLLSERPFLTMQEVASLTGFSSRIVFSNAFTKETGLSPREWSKMCNNS